MTFPDSPGPEVQRRPRVPGPRLGFETAGSAGRPAVVLLHPTGLGPLAMEPLVAELSIDHRVIIPARRGYPGSRALARASSLGEHADDVVALLDELQLDRASLVGVSAGATLVLELASRYPDRFSAMVAHEPLIGPLAPDLHAVVSEAIGELVRQADRAQVAGFVASLVGVETWSRLPPSWRQAVEVNADAALSEVGLYANFAPSDEYLHRLAGGSLVATVGERSGPGRQQVASTLRSFGLAVRVVPRVAHLAQFENPHALIEILQGSGHVGEGAVS